ncbi:N-carbamoyl-L-amino acid hydrolase [Granulibacter bethesdensis]|uniref:N-carbamoyl-L-amino acid hydrolase n=2 Tax=Granulibacter bethesdensis TaxID=364410 RepID=A0AAC9P7I6_9PROT|nr:N-carbamoyl-L-amino acid hydrolase [Granulibacter bethesdensis]APH61115.1 N-carbamoyl-L-amino acid hydrolase [Granulibacter bethesdensis]
MCSGSAMRAGLQGLAGRARSLPHRTCSRQEQGSMSGSNRRINGERLWDSLMEMAQIGATPKGGVRRLALTAEDRAGRDRLAALGCAAGYAVRTDAIGNMFLRREGETPDRKPVLLGSHLDSQPSGGKFDGALGVMAALEVLRTLDEHGIVTQAPIELVNWTDEEGSRFGRGLLGSGVWAGVNGLEETLALRDHAGISVAEALEGIAGDAPAEAFPADSYFELHIEQGPILEAENADIGIVTGAQAQIWWDVIVTGQDAHAGTTPPSVRKDALLCAARIIDLVDRMMRARGEAGRGTVGELHVLPNSRNVIPGEVRFTVEFRHPDDAEIARIAAQFPREAGFIARDCDVSLALEPVLRLASQPFDPSCVALVAEAAARHGYAAREIVSGAGHDAIYVARRLPVAMIFVPCLNGLSHNEAESITRAQAEAGAQVLFDAVLARAGIVG